MRRRRCCCRVILVPDDVARVVGRWFGNTRVISPEELDKFREEMTAKAADPYSVLLRRRKIPMGLLQDTQKVAKTNLLETESFEAAFGSKQLRKRPKLVTETGDLGALLQMAQSKQQEYEHSETKAPGVDDEDTDYAGTRHKLFDKGQSKRIWAELYKVLDCSDVVLQVVDARNVPGTRCIHVERHLKKNAPHKHLVIIVNKCDLVPNWVTRRWVQELSKEYPTIAFHASMTNSFGKGALITLLRQFGKLHADKREISVGIIGYPNVGKSSIINTLKSKKVCNVAPIPGETKVWQYVSLFRRISLIDCPGVVYDVGDDEVLRITHGGWFLRVGDANVLRGLMNAD